MRSFSLFLLVIMASCSNPPERTKSFERRSYSEGEKIYQQTCIQCHQADGKGLNDLYPPLANSDFLLANKQRAACIIWKGIEGPIRVNGKEYNMKMLPVNGMSLTKVTDVMNYIYNSWGNTSETVITEEEVKGYLDSCK